jgi:hypothetical protein
MSSLQRAALGFVAGFVAVLIFHQGVVGALHVLNLPGMSAPAPWSLRPVPPFAVPQVIDAAFWGGVWGVLFAFVQPRIPAPAWVSGLGLGVAAVLAIVFIVGPIKGTSASATLAAWGVTTWARLLLIHLVWGAGTGLILTLLSARMHRTRIA